MLNKIETHGLSGFSNFFLGVKSEVSRREFLKLSAVAVGGGVVGFSLAIAEVAYKPFVIKEALANPLILSKLPYINEEVVIAPGGDVPLENGVVASVRLDKMGLTFQVMRNKDNKTVRVGRVGTKNGDGDKKPFSSEDLDKYKPMPSVITPEQYWQMKNRYAVRLSATPDVSELAAVRVLPGVKDNMVPVALRNDQGILVREVVSPEQIILDEKVISKIKNGGFPIEDVLLDEQSLRLKKENVMAFAVAQERADKMFRGEMTEDYGLLRELFFKDGFSENEFNFSFDGFTREQLIDRLVRIDLTRNPKTSF